MTKWLIIKLKPQNVLTNISLILLKIRKIWKKQSSVSTGNSLRDMELAIAMYSNHPGINETTKKM